MSNIRNKVISMIISVVVISFNISCNITSGKAGHTGSIEKAKELGVFVTEYGLKEEKVFIDSLFHFSVNSIWLENIWFQGKTRDKAIIVDGYYLLMEIPAEQKDTIEHYLGSILNLYQLSSNNNYGGGFRGYGDKIFYTLKYDKIPNTGQKIRIIKGRIEPNTPRWEDPVFLDEITLVKK